LLNPELGFGSLALILVLIAIRVPIGVALGIVAFLDFWIQRNINVAFGVMRSTPFEVAANGGLSAIPMFILMGAIAHNTGISAALFRAAGSGSSASPAGSRSPPTSPIAPIPVSTRPASEATAALEDLKAGGRVIGRTVLVHGT
jgi:hypothetical protein